MSRLMFGRRVTLADSATHVFFFDQARALSLFGLVCSSGAAYVSHGMYPHGGRLAGSCTVSQVGKQAAGRRP